VEATSLQARLTWTRPDGEKVEFPLSGAVLVVGRDETADVRVDEPLVSRNHARLEYRGDAWFVLDLGSTNLTRVNGDVVSERQLRHGDEVRFARAQCQFAFDSGPDPISNGV
jgi:pSer/pThr/pTyr-binding forkhead associated (FHA) protein